MRLDYADYFSDCVPVSCAMRRHDSSDCFSRGGRTIDRRAALADGSVVTLIGDSITHGGSWHRSVAEYCATRFPERSIRFWNGGIAGDSAGGVLTRLEKDILIQRPNAAVVLLGMNDVRSWLYKNGAESDPQVGEKRRQAHADYVKNMGVLVDRLQREGIHPIVLMTPSPYDETAQIAR